MLEDDNDVMMMMMMMTTVIMVIIQDKKISKTRIKSKNEKIVPFPAT